MGQKFTMEFTEKDPIDEDAKSGKGPRGLGDPDDFSLREKEIYVNIPSYQRQAAENIKCRNKWNGYQECADIHTFPGFQCRNEFGQYADCLHHWMFDPDYRTEITQEYLLVRQEYRITGRRRLYRALKGETYITENQLKGFQV